MYLHTTFQNNALTKWPIILAKMFYSIVDQSLYGDDPTGAAWRSPWRIPTPNAGRRRRRNRKLNDRVRPLQQARSGSGIVSGPSLISWIVPRSWRLVSGIISWPDRFAVSGIVAGSNPESDPRIGSWTRFEDRNFSQFLIVAFRTGSHPHSRLLRLLLLDVWDQYYKLFLP